MIILVLVLGFGLIFFYDVLTGHVVPTLNRIADAQVRSAAALEDIAESLDMEFCDSDDNLSDSTRIVAALEKLAQIPAPEPKKQTTEGEAP